MNEQPVIEKENGEEKLVGYRCGACRHRFLNESDLFQGLTEEEAKTWSPEIAAQNCCVCDRKDCRKQTDIPRRQFCGFCYWKLSFSTTWLRIGSAIRLGISDDIVWEIIEDQLDYGAYMHALECRLKRYEFYETAKVNCDGCSKRLEHASFEIVGEKWLCEYCAPKGDKVVLNDPTNLGA